MLFFGHIGITVGVVFLVLLLLKRNVDYRIVMIGSMLPDIIDKPLGIYIFTQALDSGRVFCHTLLFAGIMILISIYLLKAKHQTWFAFFSFASILHIIEDQMWTYPTVLYWPLLGLDFGHRVGGNYIATIILRNYDNLYTYETEFIGIAILALFVVYYKLYEPARLKAFILKGTLHTPINLSSLTSNAINRITPK